MMNKRNTFTDFIAVADHLVKEGYTATDRLVIEGGSAGACSSERPQHAPRRVHAAILRVPFVDVINTMLDESLPLTVGEFEEWGNPKIREQYEYMKTYCPIPTWPRARTGHPGQDLAERQSGHVLGARQVGGQAARAERGRSPPVQDQHGRGSRRASGRYDYLREIALDYAWCSRSACPPSDARLGRLRLVMAAASLVLGLAGFGNASWPWPSCRTSCRPPPPSQCSPSTPWCSPSPSSCPCAGISLRKAWPICSWHRPGHALGVWIIVTCPPTVLNRVIGGSRRGRPARVGRPLSERLTDGAGRSEPG